MSKRQSQGSGLSLVLKDTLNATPRTDLPNQVEAFLKDAQEVVRDATGGALKLRSQLFPSGMGFAKSVRIDAGGKGHETVLFRVFVDSRGIRIEVGGDEKEFTTIGELQEWWSAQLANPDSYTIRLMRAMRDQYAPEPSTT
jgi:hypothetical protein